MSWEAVTWVVELGIEKKLDPTKRHILLVMANRADEFGNLFPSVAWICHRTGYSERAVRQHMKELNQAGVISRAARSGPDGSRTSDMIKLEMHQASLPLGTPPAKFAPPPAPDAPTPLQDVHLPPAPGAPDFKEESKRKKTLAKGAKAPSAVAEAWKAYSQAVAGRYGVTPPSNARANGQLANVIGRVGAEAAVKIATYYLAAPETFYAKTNHSLDYLVRDCEKLWMDLQRQAGQGNTVTAPTCSKVSLILADGKPLELQEYPLGNPLDTARKAARDYAMMIGMRRPKYIAVQQGGQRQRYTIEELHDEKR